MKTIYRIKCLINNKVYIGQTIHLEKREYEHKNDLKSKRHANKQLQEDFDKYGWSNFITEVIEVVDDDCGNEREDYWIDYYGGINCENVYNAMTSLNKSNSTKSRLSQYYLGKSHIEIHGEAKANHMRELNSIKHKGKKPVYVPYKGKVKHEKLGMIPVTEELYHQIKNLRDSGKTYKEIMDITGIGTCGVRNIIKDTIQFSWKCND